jgi:hypothetical protein
MKPLDTVNIPFTLNGPYGQAWRLAEPTFTPKPGKSTIDAWLVTIPSAHPVWHSYSFTCIHLRDIPDAPPCRIALEGATHEISIYALHPESPREPAINTCKFDTLQPINFAAQIISSSDEAARTVMMHTVAKMINGELNPDTDYQRHWVALFGDNLIKK